MALDRRRVLKSIGAASTASVLTVGSATADENCTETVYTWEENLTFAGVGVAGQFSEDEVPVFATITYQDRPSGYTESDLEGRRLDATATWGAQNAPGEPPVEQGPNDIALTLQQFGGSETVAVLETGNETNPAGESRLELQLEEGETGPGGSDELVLEDGVGYQYVLEARNGTGLFLDITTEFQAFDPACVEESSG
jgi:hypothetical protein